MNKISKHDAPLAAQSELDFFHKEILPESNKERDFLGFPQVDHFIYAIEGLNDCYSSEVILNEKHSKGYSETELQNIVSKTGSTCVVSSDLEKIKAYLIRCYLHGNSDISVNDFHTKESTLLYITWTNSPV